MAGKIGGNEEQQSGSDDARNSSTKMKNKSEIEDWECESDKDELTWYSESTRSSII